MLPKSITWLRSNLEWIGCALIICVTLWEGTTVIDNFHRNLWSISQFYSAIFSWASVQGALLFSVYAFFLSRSEPFIRAVSKTFPFRQMRVYILRTLWLTIILNLISLPLMVAPPVPARAGLLDPGFDALLVLVAMFSLAFLRFLKIVRVFRLLEGELGK